MSAEMMSTVWQWVPHEPVWDDGRCVRCGVTVPGRAIHDREWAMEVRGEYVPSDITEDR